MKQITQFFSGRWKSEFNTRIFKNRILTAPDYCLHNRLTFYNFITSYLEKNTLSKVINIVNKVINGCFFQLILRQNEIWFLS